MSTIKTNDILEATTGGAKFFVSRAWVSMNAVGTLAIRASGNVSSVTDVATGRQTVTFDTDFSDVSYAVTTAGEREITGYTRTLLVSIDSLGDPAVSTGSVRLLSQTDSNSNQDGRYVCMTATR
tara:strand:+ start:398 stop:769 length:372 start_codon:yes stop_codon:yes gene_type:complete